MEDRGGTKFSSLVFNTFLVQLQATVDNEFYAEKLTDIAVTI